MGGALGGDNLTVSVNTDGNFASGMAQNAAASNQLGSALQQLAASVQQINSAAALLSAAVNDLGASETQAGATSENLGASLNDVGAAANNAGTAMTSGGESGGGLMAALASLGSGFGDAAGQVTGFAGGLLEAMNPLNLFHSSVMRLVEVMGLWRIFEEGSRIISELVSNITQLPVAMQQTEMAWQYTFGMGQTVNPTGNVGIAQGISQQLAAWSARESYNLPYTRQDMMSGITNLSMANLTPTGVEQYLPEIADLAAGMTSYGGSSPLTLNQATYAVQGAMQGMSRMLRYELRINPDDLTQYGYDASSPDTLLPALQAYGIAKHRIQYAKVDPKTGQPLVDDQGNPLSGDAVDPNAYSADVWSQMLANRQVQDVGGSYNMAHHTWTGAWSSLQDRLQNFALDIGGYPAFNSPDGTKAGELRPGSPLDMAMQGLNAFTAWWDANQHKFDAMASFFSKTLGKAMADAGAGLEGFAQGLAKSGLGDLLAKGMGNFSAWLSNPQTQQTIKNVSGQVGGDLGSSLTDALTGLKESLDGFKKLFDSLGPNTKKSVVDAITIPGNVLGVLGAALGGDAAGLGDIARGWLKGGANLYSAYTTGDKTGAKALLGGIGQNMNDVGGGMANAWDIVMNWAGNPNGYKPGSAQNWWKGVEKHTGAFGGNLNHALGQADSWIGTNVGGGIGKGLYWLGFGDHSHIQHSGNSEKVVQDESGLNKWLDQQNGNFDNWSGGVVGGIGNFFSGMGNDLHNTIGGPQGLLKGLGTALSGLNSPLTTVKTLFATDLPGAIALVTTPLTTFKNMLSNDFATALTNAHTWLSNISTAFQTMVTWAQNLGTALSHIPGLSLLFPGSGGSGSPQRVGGTPGSRSSAGTVGGSFS